MTIRDANNHLLTEKLSVYGRMLACILIHGHFDTIVNTKT